MCVFAQGIEEAFQEVKRALFRVSRDQDQDAGQTGNACDEAGLVGGIREGGNVGYEVDCRLQKGLRL